MSRDLFQQACDNVIDNIKISNGIGTLGEKTIHAVLKNYLSPDTSYHEIKVGRYYADILCDNEIIEIQTRSFDKLRSKLEAFLENYLVTIVYPIPYTKWLRWVDIETGEISLPRKSPKCGTPYLIFPELYKIKMFLLHPNLSIQIMMIDLHEYRFLDGWSKDKKKGSSRCDRIPTNLKKEIFIHNLKDYSQLIPQELDENFTSSDFKKASRISMGNAVTALNILDYVGAVKRIGKKGNAYLYSR